VKVVSIGAGPAGLYFALLMKKADPAHDILVVERNRPDDTFGFGVVFSDATLDTFADADPETHAEITRSFAHWDDIDIHYRGEVLTSTGHGFAGLSRQLLLDILRRRCAELGVTLRWETEVGEVDAYADADLVLAADGVNSLTRACYATAFEPRLAVEGSKYIWLGTTLPLHSFTFFFVENAHGRFQAHAYPYDQRMSTFIVECDERTWRNAGLDHTVDAPLGPGVSDLASVEYCQQLFAEHLAGHPLVVNNSKWLDWTTVRNRRWHHNHVVLLGDAAHTAHFSIGSGTKLALEDAIALVDAIKGCDALHDGLDDY
jgi:anthraniloyl-CoA monooxygenase